MGSMSCMCSSRKHRQAIPADRYGFLAGVERHNVGPEHRGQDDRDLLHVVPQPHLRESRRDVELLRHRRGTEKVLVQEQAGGQAPVGLRGGPVGQVDLPVVSRQYGNITPA